MFDNVISSFRFLVNLCIIFVIFLVLFTIVYWSLPDTLMQRVSTYLQIITVFILLLTSMVNIITFRNQLDDRKRSLYVQYSNMAQNEINDIDKMFMNNQLLDRLYFEMYSNVPHVKEIAKLRQPIIVTPELLKHEHHMASIIFQKIADVYFCEQLDSVPFEDGVEWVNSFKSWLRSPILRSHWNYMKHEHHPAVCRFVDSLLTQQ